MEAPGSRIDAAGLSDLGRERAHNEDSYLIASLRRSLLVHDANVPSAARGWLVGVSPGTLLVVADGMGAPGSGDVASHVAVKTIAEYLLNVMPWAATQWVRPGAQPPSVGIREQLAAAVAAGDTSVRREALRPGVSRTMGTTLTIAYVLESTLYVAHVGDSRCYLVRDGALSRLTTDHTVAQQMREQGMSEADVPPFWSDVLWNALGGDDHAPEPQLVTLSLRPGDAIVLCSDGLTKHVSDEEIRQVVDSGSSPAEACRSLVALANAGGGTDNITVLVARPMASSAA